MGTGLTFDEYIELTAMPMAGADSVFVQVVEEERERMFPMPLIVAANHLRSRGYDCRPALLELLIRNSIVTPADPDAWSQADVDAAAEHFEDCQVYTPYSRTAARSSTARSRRRPTSTRWIPSPKCCPSTDGTSSTTT